MFPTSYYPADFFSPSYWPRPTTATPPPPPPPPPAPAAARDTTILRDIQSRLVATGVFDDVFRYGPAEWQRPAGQTAVAFIEHDRFEEDQLLGGRIGTRKMDWKLTLLVRDEDPVSRFEKLDLLYVTAANALVGKSLAGVCVTRWTKLGDGRYLRSAPPEKALELPGTCTYHVPDYAARDTTNPEGY